MERVTEALSWIVALLSEREIPFQAVGGLAARAYGSTRELADLDFYMPMERFGEIEADVSPYLARRPTPHRDEYWDLTFGKLSYAGQTIELGDSRNARYYDRRLDEWVAHEIDFSISEWHEVFGVMIPVIPKVQLIAYKRGLDRDVDRQDVAEILLADWHRARQPLS